MIACGSERLCLYHWPFKVMTAVITLVAFLFTVIPPDIAQAATSQAAKQSQTGTDPLSFKLPQNLGIVKYSWSPNNNPTIQQFNYPTIVHVQDAHCNYFAQKRIAEIIAYLNAEYGIDTVNLEGGARDYDISIFTDIGDKKKIAAASEYFLKEGAINGAEYFAVNNPDRISLWGIEDVGLYIDNLKVYRNSLKEKTESEKYLRRFDQAFASLKSRIYSRDLLELDETHAGFAAKNIELKEYVKRLIELAKARAIDTSDLKNIAIITKTFSLEKGIDFKKANMERERLIDELDKRLSKREMAELVANIVAFKLCTISASEFYRHIFAKAAEVRIDLGSFKNLVLYSAYISAYSALKNDELFDEIDALELRIKESLFQNDDQRKLDRLSANLHILKNIFNLTLTSKEYDYYKKHKDDFRSKGFIDFVRENSDASDVPAIEKKATAYLDELRAKMERFYECSLKRDKAFVRNIRLKGPGSSSQGPGKRQKSAILITGGFHTENLCEHLKKEGIAYVSIMPNFKNENGYECPYFRVLSGAKNIRIKEAMPTILASTLATPSQLNPAIDEAAAKVPAVELPAVEQTEPQTETAVETPSAITTNAAAIIDRFHTRLIMDDEDLTGEEFETRLKTVAGERYQRIRSSALVLVVQPAAFLVFLAKGRFILSIFYLLSSITCMTLPFSRYDKNNGDLGVFTLGRFSFIPPAILSAFAYSSLGAFLPATIRELLIMIWGSVALVNFWYGVIRSDVMLRHEMKHIYIFLLLEELNNHNIIQDIGKAERLLGIDSGLFSIFNNERITSQSLKDIEGRILRLVRSQTISVPSAEKSKPGGGAHAFTPGTPVMPGSLFGINWLGSLAASPIAEEAVRAAALNSGSWTMFFIASFILTALHANPWNIAQYRKMYKDAHNGREPGISDWIQGLFIIPLAAMAIMAIFAHIRPDVQGLNLFAAFTAQHIAMNTAVKLWNAAFPGDGMMPASLVPDESGPPADVVGSYYVQNANILGPAVSLEDFTTLAQTDIHGSEFTEILERYPASTGQSTDAAGGEYLSPNEQKHLAAIIKFGTRRNIWAHGTSKYNPVTGRPIDSFYEIILDGKIFSNFDYLDGLTSDELESLGVTKKEAEGAERDVFVGPFRDYRKGDADLSVSFPYVYGDLFIIFDPRTNDLKHRPSRRRHDEIELGLTVDDSSWKAHLFYLVPSEAEVRYLKARLTRDLLNKKIPVAHYANAISKIIAYSDFIKKYEQFEDKPGAFNINASFALGGPAAFIVGHGMMDAAPAVGLVIMGLGIIANVYLLVKAYQMFSGWRRAKLGDLADIPGKIRSLARRLDRRLIKYLWDEGLFDKEKPLGEYEIKRLHFIATDKSMPADNVHIPEIADEFMERRGEYRRTDVLSLAVTPVDKVDEEMKDFAEWLRTREREVSKEKVEEFAAEAYLRFIEIHPFANANDRAGRFLINLILLRGGRPAIDMRLIKWAPSVTGYRALLPGDAEFFASLIRRAQAGKPADDYARYGKRSYQKIPSIDDLLSTDNVKAEDLLNSMRSFIGRAPPALGTIKSIYEKTALGPEEFKEFLRILETGREKSTSVASRREFDQALRYFKTIEEERREKEPAIPGAAVKNAFWALVFSAVAGMFALLALPAVDEVFNGDPTIIRALYGVAGVISLFFVAGFGGAALANAGMILFPGLDPEHSRLAHQDASSPEFTRRQVNRLVWITSAILAMITLKIADKLLTLLKSAPERTRQTRAITSVYDEAGADKVRFMSQRRLNEITRQFQYEDNRVVGLTTYKGDEVYVSISSPDPARRRDLSLDRLIDRLIDGFSGEDVDFKTFIKYINSGMFDDKTRAYVMNTAFHEGFHAIVARRRAGSSVDQRRREFYRIILPRLHDLESIGKPFCLSVFGKEELKDVTGLVVGDNRKELLSMLVESLKGYNNNTPAVWEEACAFILGAMATDSGLLSRPEVEQRLAIDRILADPNARHDIDRLAEAFVASVLLTRNPKYLDGLLSFYQGMGIVSPLSISAKKKFDWYSDAKGRAANEARVSSRRPVTALSGMTAFLGSALWGDTLLAATGDMTKTIVEKIPQNMPPALSESAFFGIVIGIITGMILFQLFVSQSLLRRTAAALFGILAYYADIGLTALEGNVVKLEHEQKDNPYASPKTVEIIIPAKEVRELRWVDLHDKTYSFGGIVRLIVIPPIIFCAVIYMLGQWQPFFEFLKELINFLPFIGGAVAVLIYPRGQSGEERTADRGETEKFPDEFEKALNKYFSNAVRIAEDMHRDWAANHGTGRYRMEVYEDKMIPLYYSFMADIDKLISRRDSRDDGAYVYPLRGPDIIPLLFRRTLSIERDIGDFNEGADRIERVLGRQLRNEARQNDIDGSIDESRDALTEEDYYTNIENCPRTLILKGFDTFLNENVSLEQRSELLKRILPSVDRVLILDNKDLRLLSDLRNAGFNIIGGVFNRSLRAASSVALTSKSFLLPDTFVMLERQKKSATPIKGAMHEGGRAALEKLEAKAAQLAERKAPERLIESLQKSKTRERERMRILYALKTLGFSHSRADELADRMYLVSTREARLNDGHSRVGAVFLNTPEGLRVLLPKIPKGEAGRSGRKSLENIDLADPDDEDLTVLGDLLHEAAELEMREAGMPKDEAHWYAIQARQAWIAAWKREEDNAKKIHKAASAARAAIPDKRDAQRYGKIELSFEDIIENIEEIPIGAASEQNLSRLRQNFIETLEGTGVYVSQVFKDFIERFITKNEISAFGKKFGHCDTKDLILILQRLHTLSCDPGNFRTTKEEILKRHLADFIIRIAPSHAQHLDILEKLGFAGPGWDDIVIDAGEGSVADLLERGEYMKILYGFNPIGNRYELSEALKAAISAEAMRNIKVICAHFGIEPVRMTENIVRHWMYRRSGEKGVFFERLRDETKQKIRSEIRKHFTRGGIFRILNVCRFLESRSGDPAIKLDRFLGAGSGGAAFVGRRSSGQKVAVKINVSNGNRPIKSVYEMLKNTKKTLRRNPYIADIDEIIPVQYADRTDIVQVGEFVEGRSLSSILSGEGFDPARAIDVTSKILRGSCLLLLGPKGINTDVENTNDYIVTTEGDVKLVDFEQIIAVSDIPEDKRDETVQKYKAALISTCRRVLSGALSAQEINRMFAPLSSCSIEQMPDVLRQIIAKLEGMRLSVSAEPRQGRVIAGAMSEGSVEIPPETPDPVDVAIAIRSLRHSPRTDMRVFGTGILMFLQSLEHQMNIQGNTAPELADLLISAQNLNSRLDNLHEEVRTASFEQMRNDSTGWLEDLIEIGDDFASFRERIFEFQIVPEHAMAEILRQLDEIRVILNNRIAFAEGLTGNQVLNVRDVVENACRPNAGVMDEPYYGNIRVVGLENSLEIKADEIMMLNALGNIVFNANEFADYHIGPGEPKVEVDVGEDGDFVLITVRNNGPEIPADMLAPSDPDDSDSAQRLFEYGVSGRPEEGHGGIGTAEARSAIVRHGGTIRAFGRQGQWGATFEIRLPKLKAASPAGLASSSIGAIQPAAPPVSVELASTAAVPTRISRTITVTEKPELCAEGGGLHARLSMAVISALQGLDVRITLTNRQNGSVWQGHPGEMSPLELMLLGVGQGKPVELETEGKDASAAAERIEALLRRGETLGTQREMSSINLRITDEEWHEIRGKKWSAVKRPPVFLGKDRGLTKTEEQLLKGKKCSLNMGRTLTPEAVRREGYKKIVMGMGPCIGIIIHDTFSKRTYAAHSNSEDMTSVYMAINMALADEEIKQHLDTVEVIVAGGMIMMDLDIDGARRQLSNREMMISEIKEKGFSNIHAIYPEQVDIGVGMIFDIEESVCYPELSFISVADLVDIPDYFARSAEKDEMAGLDDMLETNPDFRDALERLLRGADAAMSDRIREIFRYVAGAYLAMKEQGMFDETRPFEGERFVFLPLSKNISGMESAQTRAILTPVAQIVKRLIKERSEGRIDVEKLSVIFYEGGIEGLRKEIASQKDVNSLNGLAYVDVAEAGEAGLESLGVTVVRQKAPEGGLCYMPVGGQVVLALGILDLLNNNRAEGSDYWLKVRRLLQAVSTEPARYERVAKDAFIQMIKDGRLEITLPAIRRAEVDKDMRTFTAAEKAVATAM